MNKYLENFMNLYSLDNEVCYKALLEKKDWMFRKIYIPVSFEKTVRDNKDLYLELYALMDQSFIFSKLGYEKDTFLDLPFEASLKLINEFNKSYRLLNVLEHIDFNYKKDTFLVEMDMTKMDDKVYRDLVANFYPAFKDARELELKYDTSITELIKLAMRQESDFVFVLSKDNLIDDKYFLPCIKALHYSKGLNNEQIEAVKEIASALEVMVYEHD